MCDGVVEEEANAVDLLFSRVWHRVVIDAGAIFWRASDAPPAVWTVKENNWKCTLIDVGSLRARIAVYFVASSKDRGIIEIIGIRYAGSQERALFFA